MILHTIRTISYSYLLSIFFSCAQSTSGMPEQGHVAPSSQSETTNILYIKATTKTFLLKTQATGTLAATATTEIKTAQPGKLISLPITEGTFTQKNATIALLDPTAIQLQLEKAQLTLEEAEFNKNDLLVMQGGTWGVDTSVNETTLLSINQQSGHKKALHAIKELEYQVGQTKITAPFSGIVADLKVNAHQHLGTGETICRLIDPLSFEVVFQLLEMEAVRAEMGQSLKVHPVASPELEFRATVSAINPIVDEHGLVRIHAAIHADGLRRNRLFDGMNVRVTLEKAVPNQLTVPKSAVVLRSGKPVVFTYDIASGLAKWNYVTIAHENDEEIAIAEGLKPGDLVIHEGNLNLDHDAEVTVHPLPSTVHQ